MLIASFTDKGIKKTINQDAIYAIEAVLDDRCAVLAAICDGMGGLDHGEYASQVMTDALDEWAENRLSWLLERNSPSDMFENEMKKLIENTDAQISEEREELCGTTFTAILLFDGYYHIAHVGDTRVYAIGKRIHQLTKDQTFIQMEMDAGRMTEEEAEKHPNKHTLLQCIGAGDEIKPAFVHGAYKPESLFLLCSDGFRNRISEDELKDALDPGRMQTEDAMQETIELCANTVMGRKEKDNISAVLIKTDRKGTRYA